MNYFGKLMIFFAAATFSHAYAQDAQDVAKATQAAAAWLNLTDTQQYGPSYAGTAPAFRQAITQPDWEQALQAVRTPLGELKHRSVKSATYAKDLPGAPRGEYVIIVYDSAFANRAGAVETVTPMRDTDGSWKVSGYFVR